LLDRNRSILGGRDKLYRGQRPRCTIRFDADVNANTNVGTGRPVCGAINRLHLRPNRWAARYQEAKMDDDSLFTWGSALIHLAAEPTPYHGTLMRQTSDAPIGALAADTRGGKPKAFY